MKLTWRKHVLLEICGKDTLRDIVVNLLYGFKYFFIDFRKVMDGAEEKLREKKLK